MKIEKIKNYNQKLLAILGTIGGIFLVVALVSFISIVIQEHRRYDYNETETGILSEEKIEKLQKENKREQVISYETPILIDTLSLKYIIPVSHKTLDEKEEIDGLGLLNGFTGSESEEYIKKMKGIQEDFMENLIMLLFLIQIKELTISYLIPELTLIK
jgi:hypothetical protein